MTLPTRDQLDAVLTRSSAGVSALTGDLRDDEERALALDWLEKTIRGAAADVFPIVDFKMIPAPKPDDVAVFRLAETTTMQEAKQILDTLRAHLPCKVVVNSSGVDLESFTTGMARIRPEAAPDSPRSDENAPDVPLEGSNRPGATQSPFPPPTKGSHESDLEIGWKSYCEYLVDGTRQSRRYEDIAYGRGGTAEYNRARDWSRTPDDRSSNT